MPVQSFYQFTRADGNPDWPTGADNFPHMWDRAYDLLRFHRGQGFQIENKQTGAKGPKVTLLEVNDRLSAQLKENPDTVFRVFSLKDDFALAFRRHTEKLDTLGKQFLDVGRELIGAPYDLGGTTVHGVDCSGVVIAESAPFGITYGLHKAAVMWAEFRAGNNGKVTIPRSKILKGDLIVFHGGDHIATYIDDEFGGRVLDAQPHSVQSPWGWTPAGCQVRSMAPNYYCSWANVNDVCRLVKINGAP